MLNSPPKTALLSKSYPRRLTDVDENEDEGMDLPRPASVVRVCLILLANHAPENRAKAFDYLLKNTLAKQD